MSGGLSRHTTLLTETKANNDNVLYLDNGGLFPQPPQKDQDLIADIGLNVAALNGLDAMNLSRGEFCFGLDYLAKKAKELNFTFVSTNILSSTPLPWLKKYSIVTKGDKKIAILGIMPENAFSRGTDTQLKNKLTIVPPETALQKIIPELEGKVDTIILLSRLSVAATTNLAKKFPEISLAIAAENINKTEPLSVEGRAQLVVDSGQNCQLFRSVILSPTKEPATFSVTEAKPVTLDDAVKHTNIVDNMITEPFTKRRKLQRQTLQRVEEQLQGNNQAVLPTAMSQDDFQKMVQEKQQELKKLRESRAVAEEGKKVGTLTVNGQRIPIVKSKSTQTKEEAAK